MNIKDIQKKREMKVLAFKLNVGNFDDPKPTINAENHLNIYKPNPFNLYKSKGEEEKLESASKK